MKHYLLALISMALLGAAQGAGAQMMSDGGGAAGDWEFRIGPVFTESKNINFDGGSSANLKSDTGIKLGTGYYLTDHLILGGNLAWGRSDFNGTVQGTNGSTAFENGRVDLTTLMFDASYTLLEGPIKPFGVVGLGWTWGNTNIATGPPQTGCWWDPWWGYVCSGYQPTKGSTSFSYQIGAGVQFNFTRAFGVNADYRYTVVNLDNASSKPGIGAIELLFVWRVGHY